MSTPHCPQSQNFESALATSQLANNSQPPSSLRACTMNRSWWARIFFITLLRDKKKLAQIVKVLVSPTIVIELLGVPDGPETAGRKININTGTVSEIKISAGDEYSVALYTTERWKYNGINLFLSHPPGFLHAIEPTHYARAVCKHKFESCGAEKEEIFKIFTYLISAQERERSVAGLIPRLQVSQRESLLLQAAHSKPGEFPIKDQEMFFYEMPHQSGWTL